MDIIVEISRERALELIEKVSRFIVKHRMAAPAIMTIESLRPLSRIGSQLMYFLAPFAEIIFNSKEYQEFAVILEKDEYIKLLLNKIDELDIEMYKDERTQKKILRKRRINKFKKSLGIKSKKEDIKK
jgi:PP-loop superfamily ATP-utilizing enzyme